MDPNNQGPPNGGGGFFQGGPGGGGRFLGPGGPLGPGGHPVMQHAVGAGFWIERVVMLVVVLLVLALLLFLLYRVLSPSGRWGANAAAIREVEMRYARGEIGRDEFLLRRHDLTTPMGKVLPPSPPAEAPPPATAPA